MFSAELSILGRQIITLSYHSYYPLVHSRLQALTYYRRYIIGSKPPQRATQAQAERVGQMLFLTYLAALLRLLKLARVSPFDRILYLTSFPQL